jgi:hypothetical protein
MTYPILVNVGPDGLCECSCGDPCPLGKSGMETRCTRAELEKAGNVVCQPTYECDFCLTRLGEDEVVDTLHFKLGSVVLCRGCYQKQGNRVR